MLQFARYFEGLSVCNSKGNMVFQLAHNLPHKSSRFLSCFFLWQSIWTAKNRHAETILLQEKSAALTHTQALHVVIVSIT